MVIVYAIAGALFTGACLAIVYHVGCEQGARLAKAGMEVEPALPTVEKIAEALESNNVPRIDTPESIVDEYDRERVRLGLSPMTKEEREANVAGWSQNMEYV